MRHWFATQHNVLFHRVQVRGMSDHRRSAQGHGASGRTGTSPAHYRLIPAVCAIFLFTGKLAHDDAPLEQTLLSPPGQDTPVQDVYRAVSDSALTLFQLPLHPSYKMTPVVPLRTVSGEVLISDTRYSDLYALFDLYELRQGVDDNFTLRVLDVRTGATLEVAELEEERAAYHASGEADWLGIDKKRRRRTEDLVDKYLDLGLPKDALAVRWGRRNQVEEARTREAHLVGYEIQLADLLGLSLLACEVGTVETFNQDELVSRAGARSRYQMMPDMLQRLGLHRHRLKTRTGATVTIRDERHPLLAMAPAFTLMRAFSNAVGHELAGLSAYHTGHNNIYRLLRLYLNRTSALPAEPDVLGAYVWALADGFETVRRRSTFRTHSRAYVPALMGSLRALEHAPIDFRNRLHAEQVSLQAGPTLALSDLLEELDCVEDRLDWGPLSGRGSTWQRFLALNPHIPGARSDSVLSAENDVLLRTINTKKPLRIFLPTGTGEVVRGVVADAIRQGSIVRFDDTLYRRKDDFQPSEWDIRYRNLVEDIGKFGFSSENKSLLEEIASGMAEQAEREPTVRNRIMKDVAEIHLMLWKSRYWRELSRTVVAKLDTRPEPSSVQSDSVYLPETMPVTK